MDWGSGIRKKLILGPDPGIEKAPDPQHWKNLSHQAVPLSGTFAFVDRDIYPQSH